MKPITLAGIGAFTALTVGGMQPARAEEPTTLQNVVARGIIMNVMGLQIPVTYTADGKFVGNPPGQKIEGVWRIDGDKLCTKVGTDAEVCAAYPAGKKPGETFDVPGAMGPQMGVIKVTIK